MNKISTKTIEKKPGIYYIKNIISKKVYIGQSKNIYKRLILHKHKLLNNKHSNSHLQRSFNKHNIENFKCGVILYCDKLLTFEEKFYINNQKSRILYNVREAEDSVKHQKRKKVSEKTRIKLSEAKKGKKPSNLKWLQQKNRRKVDYYINNKLIKTFDSCKDAAEYFNIKSNTFNHYVGKKSRNSKYFPLNYQLKYRKEVNDG